MKYKRLFGCHLYWRPNFNKVSICIYVAFTYEEAFRFFEDKTQKRKSGWFVREMGGDSKYQWKIYDERYAARLLAEDDVRTDEFYKEPSTDDKARVDIHNKFKIAKWRGIRRL